MKVNIETSPKYLECKWHERFLQWKSDSFVRTKLSTPIKFLTESVQYYIYDPINFYYYRHKELATDVIIEPRDTESMDHVMATIISPMLVQFRDNQWSSPAKIDTTEDIPKVLLNATTDQQWDWILEEMIYAFDRLSVETQISDSDRDGRIANGLRLFGKYYRSLWH